MYLVSKKLKLICLVSVVIGIIFLVTGFATTPNSVEDLKHYHTEQPTKENEHKKINSHHDEAHTEHSLHQMQNRPWSALYVSVLFFMAIALGAAFFLCIQYVTQAGWSVVVQRVMEGIVVFIPIGGIIILIIFLASGLHMNHIFHWMVEGITDPNSENYDSIIAGKSGYLNFPFFFVRAIIYIVGWTWFMKVIRKNSLAQDASPQGNKFWKRNFNMSAAFLVFFGITSSTGAWDWIMSLDPHWFSTLFGWYVFSGMFVTSVTVMAMITIYLKNKGLMPQVNDSHLHDLTKFMFAISIFWTYLWFSQFLLIWYSDIPEEVTYYMARFDDYKTPFFTMLVLNFVCPLLILINSDFKRIPWFILFAGILIIIGHWLDIFVMVMPGTVGMYWYIGLPEIGGFLATAGIFVYVVMNQISKVSLLPKGNPFLKESENFHY